MFLVYFLVWGFLFTFSLVIFYWSAVALQCVCLYIYVTSFLFIYIYVQWNIGHKNNEIMPSAATRVDLEILILS